MHVRFARVNEDDNSFDLILVSKDVTPDQFERMRPMEAAADEPEEIVADLHDDAGLRDTIVLPRQRFPLAAVVLKSEP